MCMDKNKKKAVMIDVKIPCDYNIRKMALEKLKKCQGLKEKIEKLWRVNASAVQVVIGPPNRKSGSNRSHEQPQRNLSRRAQSLDTAQKSQDPSRLVEDPSLKSSGTPKNAGVHKINFNIYCLCLCFAFL